jgi:hypothetical protein
VDEDESGSSPLSDSSTYFVELSDFTTTGWYFHCRRRKLTELNIYMESNGLYSQISFRWKTSHGYEMLKAKVVVVVVAVVVVMMIIIIIILLNNIN